MARADIIVYPRTGIASPAIWSALERLVQVSFVDYDPARNQSRPVGYIFLSPNPEIETRALEECAKIFVVDAKEVSSQPQEEARRVVFGSSPTLDRRLRGRSVSHNAVRFGGSPGLDDRDTILASCGDAPCWVTRRLGSKSTDLVFLPLPEIGQGEHPVDYLTGSNFIRLLPLLHYLREVAGRDPWDKPGLRAAFMFDDPNLHWSSYGFIPFPELVARAKKNRFHASFAMVPFDAWHAHKPTARLFIENQSEVSLLVHGNDHTRGELAGPTNQEECLALIGQSLRRIASFEKRTGVPVGRVMAPPHGAYTEAILPVMLSLGFEGACISPWSLRDWGPNRAWPASLGLEPAEMMDDSFPVIPRFRLSSSCEGQVVVSAFLDRPIIPVGHHDTLADGIELLDRIAAVINAYDDVSWASPAEILRSNYHHREENGVLHLKPFSAQFTVTIPAGINAIVLHRAGPGIDSAPLSFAVSSVSSHRAPLLVNEQQPLPVTGGSQLDIRLAKLGAVSFSQVKSPKVSYWPPLRRVLCEARDRLVPLLPRKSTKA